MASIHFFKEDVEFRLPPFNRTQNWLKRIARKEQFYVEELNFIFCSDKYLHQINRQYLRHDTYTDIITFDNSDDSPGLRGDIFISVERVRENALKFGQRQSKELRRVMAHGLLHLMGYTDKTPGDKQVMRLKEDEALFIY